LEKEREESKRSGWAHQFGIEVVVSDRSHGMRIGSIGNEERNEKNPIRERSEIWTLRIYRYWRL